MKRVTAVLAGLVVLAAILLAWLVARPASDPVKPRIGEDGTYAVGTIPGDERAVRTATEVLSAALSYDYRTLEDGMDTATRQMTDSFATEFRATFDKTAGKLAPKEQAVSRSLVRGAGLVESDEDHATCVVFLDQVLVESKDRAGKAPITVSKNRVLVTLRKEDGDWKVDGIEPF
ncbi:hypothetical protein [Nocardioides antri]|uniref:Mce-associated membrane protein n=1 Tax=Nocardioides antri TaxID=2607659 RepID=A0A5B1M4X5_9ACTN|nr:hypothetical protein [Nocardioides antri]KAA1427811.1 hypothetical protein F0U47_10320 [Nocardioides antri]